MQLFKKKDKTEENYDGYGSFRFDEYRMSDDDILSKFGSEIIPKEPLKTEKVRGENRSRLMIGYFFLLLIMVLLIFRMGYWQIIKSNDLKIMATEMQKVDTEIDAVRGSIYDSRMNTLAETVTEYELYGYTYDLYKSEQLTGIEKDNTLKKLIEITGEEKKDLLKALQGDENLALLADGLSKDDVDKAVKMWGSSVYVKTKIARYYPNGAFAAQLLGGVDSENKGRTGLEYEYNSVLAGIKGRTVETTDSAGNTLANSNGEYYSAQDGYSIVTSIDSVIQHYVEDALAAGMQRTGASSISCIVMRPKTGEILALAQTPEYNPNQSTRPSDKSEYAKFKKMSDKQQSEYLSKMWTIEQVSNIYEPGSTFKLISAASSLETGHSTLNSSYYCNGGITVGNTRLKCLGHHGNQSLKKAVGNSCNSALGRVALNMGASTFYNYIDLFGFNDQTGIDLPGETTSIVKNPDGLAPVDLATTGYGQGIAITPLQMLCAVNCFGNDGVLMQPKIVSKIIDKDGKTIETKDAAPVRQVISKETCDQMREIMEYYVAEGGGGDKAYVPGYRVGGKTGTANIAANGGYSEATDCSFTAMAPMDDPQISMLVIVHKPTKTQYGNFSAGPIIKSIMEKSLMYLGVEREMTDKEAAAAKKNKVSVPKAKGKDSAKVVAELDKLGLKHKYVPENSGKKSFVVKDQYPKSGTKVKKGTTVYLYSE
ncbi:MAG: PASTA domain-containing protein [Clostridiales bacterium]|nr:PASTA domain-containing protein [Candidatus Crickella equi]